MLRKTLRRIRVHGLIFMIVTGLICVVPIGCWKANKIQVDTAAAVQRETLQSQADQARWIIDEAAAIGTAHGNTSNEMELGKDGSR